LAKDFFVRFWGVRGSIPCPGPETLRYGGNTSCVELRFHDHLLIFDAGSGLKRLGDSLKLPIQLPIYLFFSHTHFDHIYGLPFFAPIYHPDTKIQIWTGHLEPDQDLSSVMHRIIAHPFFPINPSAMSAQLSFHDFRAGESLHLIPNLHITTAPLRHPGEATAYRVESGGRSVCYVTDTEHQIGTLNQDILNLIQGADIFIYDSTYTDEEYPRFVGWGHSTWQEGVRLAKAAGVRTFVAFHHDPTHDDDFLDHIQAEMDALMPGARVAREGMILHL
jgi:phosphoribosyl 1,2-cyclic phosphodiesterase